VHGGANGPAVRASATRIVGITPEARRPMYDGGLPLIRFVPPVGVLFVGCFLIVPKLIVASAVLFVVGELVVWKRAYAMGIYETPNELIVRNTWSTTRVPWTEVRAVDDELGRLRVRTSARGDLFPDVGRPRQGIDPATKPFARIVTRLNEEIAKHSGLSNAS
jgi:hypothetical protein